MPSEHDLKPRAVLDALRKDLPTKLHRHVLLVGSLAAAYHFETELERNVIRTKDADVIVQPAGDIKSAVKMAEVLLAAKWRRTDECRPQPTPTPPAGERLEAVRLHPPKKPDYFIEILALPLPDQREDKRWTPIKLADGYYGLPSFRFMVVLAMKPIKSHVGIPYAHPALMALANLLHHPKVGTETISKPLFGRSGILRAAKDLGRVLAIASLTERNARAKEWLPLWEKALRSAFPTEATTLAAHVGDGLRELLSHEVGLEQARFTTDQGLLRGRGVSIEVLAAIGRQVLGDIVAPLATGVRAW